jgi:hypothetical protein
MVPVIGFYLAGIATKEQKPCPTGKFKSVLSFDACQSCPIGKYASANASTYCNQCQENMVTENHGSDDVGLCMCEASFYMEKIDGERICKACLPRGSRL